MMIATFGRLMIGKCEPDPRSQQAITQVSAPFLVRAAPCPAGRLRPAPYGPVRNALPSRRSSHALVAKTAGNSRTNTANATGAAISNGAAVS